VLARPPIVQTDCKVRKRLSKRRKEMALRKYIFTFLIIYRSLKEEVRATEETSIITQIIQDKPHIEVSIHKEAVMAFIMTKMTPGSLIIPSSLKPK
jgi:hypothetical protein